MACSFIVTEVIYSNKSAKENAQLELLCLLRIKLKRCCYSDLGAKHSFSILVPGNGKVFAACFGVLNLPPDQIYIVLPYLYWCFRK